MQTKPVKELQIIENDFEAALFVCDFGSETGTKTTKVCSAPTVKKLCSSEPYLEFAYNWEHSNEVLHIKHTCQTTIHRRLLTY